MREKAVSDTHRPASVFADVLEMIGTSRAAVRLSVGSDGVGAEGGGGSRPCSP